LEKELLHCKENQRDEKIEPKKGAELNHSIAKQSVKKKKELLVLCEITVIA
jgi:hypothetical protein